MSETKVTPEPWSTHLRHGKINVYALTQLGRREGTTKTVATIPGASPENEANARRIVACVNACAGIPSEALEAGAVAEVLASLRLCVGALVSDLESSEPEPLSVQSARAAIAKATGR